MAGDVECRVHGIKRCTICLEELLDLDEEDADERTRWVHATRSATGERLILDRDVHVGPKPADAP
jgi:hypothetical protein